MASIINHTGDGTTDTYNVTFTYIDANDVAVTVNDVAASFTFLTDTSIQLSSVPASGDAIVIKRITPVSALVDFTDGSTLFEADLDLSARQTRFLSEEARDRADNALTQLNANIANINRVADIASDVTSVAGIVANVTAVAADATDIGAVATNISNVNAVASNETNINAVNANATNINAVNSNSANINTVATNSANITTVAGYDQAHLSTVHNNIATLNSISGMFSATSSIAVTVVNSGGNKFALDGVTAPALTLVKGFTYTFDVSDASNSGHPLAFKDVDGNAFTTGVTVNGTAGTAGATVVIVVPTTGTMPARYYCTAHGNGMGNTIATQTDSIGTVASDIANVNTVASNLSTIAQKATVDEATALAIEQWRVICQIHLN